MEAKFNFKGFVPSKISEHQVEDILMNDEIYQSVLPELNFHYD